MRNRSRSGNRSAAVVPKETSAGLIPQQPICYEGESLVHLLKSIQREIESARLSDTSLPDKIWLKQQFSIGINEVTRVLERMPPLPGGRTSPFNCAHDIKASPIRLQAILIASDCNPRWLTKHLPSLASSRKVPLITVKDKRGGSLKLGELVKLKTAIAIGVKARGNVINKLIEEILRDYQVDGGVET